jgi:16S rRNA (guanine527-N7)-methyltransferase
MGAAEIMPFLRQALADIPSDDVKLDLLAKHWGLLERWQRRVNLTAIKDAERAAWLHYRDSLELLPFVTSGDLVDIGTGGGFPGIPIAVFKPELAVTIVDAKQKKISFLETVVAELAIKNVTPICCRMEQPCRFFGTAVTRATFSSTKELLKCGQWLKPRGQLIAMRAAKSEYESSKTHSYTICGADRVLEFFSRETIE